MLVAKKALNLILNSRVLVTSHSFVSQHLLLTNLGLPSARCLSVSSPRLTTENRQEVPIVPAEVVEHAIKYQIVLIDVRKHEEVAQLGKIPTANVLPVDDVESALKLNPDDFRSTYHFEKPLSSSLIVLYCRSGKRSGRAVEIFRDKFGYKNAVSYQGSWNEWSEKHPEDVKDLTHK